MNPGATHPSASVPMPPMRYFFRKQPPHIAGRPSHHLPDHEAFLFPFRGFPVVSQEAYESWQSTHRNEEDEQQGSDGLPDKRLQPIKDATGEEIVDPNADDLKLARLKRDIQVLGATEAMVVENLLLQLEGADAAIGPDTLERATPCPVWVVFHVGGKKTTRQPPVA